MERTGELMAMNENEATKQRENMKANPRAEENQNKQPLLLHLHQVLLYVNTFGYYMRMWRVCSTGLGGFVHLTLQKNLHRS